MKALSMRIAMIFREPGNALNPTMTIGEHSHEAVMAHLQLSRAAWNRETELLSLRQATYMP